MKAVGQPIRKKDAMALVTGKPVFMDDLAPKDCLIVKLRKAIDHTELKFIFLSFFPDIALCFFQLPVMLFHRLIELWSDHGAKVPLLLHLHLPELLVKYRDLMHPGEDLLRIL